MSTVCVNLYRICGYDMTIQSLLYTLTTNRKSKLIKFILIFVHSFSLTLSFFEFRHGVLKSNFLLLLEF